MCRSFGGEEEEEEEEEKYDTKTRGVNSTRMLGAFWVAACGLWCTTYHVDLMVKIDNTYIHPIIAYAP